MTFDESETALKEIQKATEGAMFDEFLSKPLSESPLAESPLPAEDTPSAP